MLKTTKVSVSKIKWLLAEIPELLKNKVIEESVGREITAYYQKQLKTVNTRSTVSTVLSGLASLLILSGIILLFGYNWYSLPKEIKTGLAFLVVIIPMVACFYLEVIRSKPFTLGLREGFALGWSLSFGAAVALIAQIYNLPENYVTYPLVWGLSTLGIVYLMDSLASAALYMVLVLVVTYRAGIGHYLPTAFIYFLPMIFGLIPHYYRQWRNDSQLGLRVILYNYFLAATLTIGVGTSLCSGLSSIWIVIYPSLFVIFYLTSVLIDDANRSLFSAPLKIAGVIGAVCVAYSASYSGAWKWKVGFPFNTAENNIQLYSMIYSYALVILLPVISLILVYVCLKRKEKINLVLASFGAFMALLYLAASFWLKPQAAAWIVSGFNLLFCLYSFYYGYKRSSLLVINGAALFLVINAAYKFTESVESLLLRGVVFIGCGILIMVLNLFFKRKFKEGLGHEK